MRITLLIAGAIFGALATTAAFARSVFNDATRKRYLLEHITSGDLTLPKDFNEWMFVGSPLVWTQFYPRLEN